MLGIQQKCSCVSKYPAFFLTKAIKGLCKNSNSNHDFVTMVRVKGNQVTGEYGR